MYVAIDTENLNFIHVYGSHRGTHYYAVYEIGLAKTSGIASKSLSRTRIAWKDKFVGTKVSTP